MPQGRPNGGRMAQTDLKSIVDRIVDLPTLPQVVTTLMSLLDDPNSSARDVNGVMSNDPALVAKILKLVNSAFYGLPNRVTSITQAITILGFNTIKALAVSASVFDLFGEAEGDFSYEGFWAHSVGTGTVGRYLSTRTGHGNPETAFVVGLLHGLGKLILDQYAPVEFQAILAKARQEGTNFAAAEPGVIQTSYADLGFWLARKWQMAEDVQVSIRDQNRIAACPEPHRPMAAILAVSAYICRLKSYGANGDFDKPLLPREAWDLLRITREELPVLIAKIDEELTRASGFLEIIRS